MKEPRRGRLKPDWILQSEVEAVVRRNSTELSRAQGFNSSDQPDIYQELMLHLHKKTKFYDSNRGSPAAYATHLLKHKKTSLFRQRNGQNYSILRKAKSLQSQVCDHDGAKVSFSEILDVIVGRRHTGQRQLSSAELAQIKIDITEANAPLPQPLKDMAAVLSHVSQYTAAKVLKISRRQAAIVVATLRNLYEARGLNA